MRLAKKAVIYVAGHRGMVGSAIVRQLLEQGFNNILCRTHQELDLTRQAEVERFFQQNKIDYLVIAAAKVGGILANNQYPAEFIYQNLLIETNLIHSAYKADIKNLLFLGSSCIYPKLARQPMEEGDLLTGTLEATNEPYAIAKIAGIKLCESYNRQYGTDYRSVMPTNLYGCNDNFDLKESHVIPALIRKIHEAKINNSPMVELWGTGQARREFLHVDDLAQACLFVMNLSSNEYSSRTKPMLSHLNIGTGVDVTIKDLAQMIMEVAGYQGKIQWNTCMPDGAPKKLLNVERLTQMGWKAHIDLKQGLQETYQWFLENYDNIRTNH